MEAIYCMLYLICVWVLLRRKRHGYLWHITSSTILFLFETISLSLEATVYVHRFFQDAAIAKGSTLSQTDSASNIFEAGIEIAALLCL
jgi:hypothetical protein